MAVEVSPEGDKWNYAKQDGNALCGFALLGGVNFITCSVETANYHFV